MGESINSQSPKWGLCFMLNGDTDEHNKPLPILMTSFGEHAGSCCPNMKVTTTKVSFCIALTQFVYLQSQRECVVRPSDWADWVKLQIMIQGMNNNTMMTTVKSWMNSFVHKNADLFSYLTKKYNM